MEFPYRHKARLSSGQGIKWTRRHTCQNKSHAFIRVQTDTSVWGGVCARMWIRINKFSFCYGFQDLGGWRGWINQRKGNYCLHSGGAFIPFACHISTGQSPQRTLLLPVVMGREEMEIICTRARPVSPFVKFLGQQSVSTGQIPPASLGLLPWQAWMNPKSLPSA